jgi:hypothetical protein
MGDGSDDELLFDGDIAEVFDELNGINRWTSPPTASIGTGKFDKRRKPRSSICRTLVAAAHGDKE